MNSGSQNLGRFREGHGSVQDSFAPLGINQATAQAKHGKEKGRSRRTNFGGAGQAGKKECLGGTQDWVRSKCWTREAHTPG